MVACGGGAPTPSTTIEFSLGSNEISLKCFTPYKFSEMVV